MEGWAYCPWPSLLGLGEGISQPANRVRGFANCAMGLGHRKTGLRNGLSSRTVVSQSHFRPFLRPIGLAFCGFATWPASRFSKTFWLHSTLIQSTKYLCQDV